VATKYGLSSVRGQLVDSIRGAYPTKWTDYKSAKVLGEDIFGSPKPHPNAVLILFEAENLRFAMPFASYRASVGGFSALVSDEPGKLLPRRTLATTIQGMHTLLSMSSSAARIATYVRYPRICPDMICALNVDINPVEKRVEMLEKIYFAVVGHREGGPLSPPSFGHLLCAKCTKLMEDAHTAGSSNIWERLAPAFGISRGWNDL
jgi:hypothetical protein